MTEIQSQNKDQLLNALFGSVVEDIERAAQKRIDDMQGRLESKMQKIDSVLSGMPLTVNLGTLEKPKNEAVHKRFNDILNILQSAKRKEKNIMLVGGAGGGKTHICKQVADALKLEFYPFSVGLQTTKSDLMGFINATGNYISSPIRKAYENGGVLLLDEFDAAHAGVVTILNSLLANGEASFPDKTVNKNEKFICICACNTYGKGANIDYIGRNRLDGATLDRFIVLDVDYDTELEKILTRNNAWHKVVTKIRENIDKQGIKVIVSPRASMDGADLLDAGFEPERVLEMVVFKGCDEDIRKKMMQGVNIEKLKEKREEPKALPPVEKEKKKTETKLVEFQEEDKNCLYIDFDNLNYSFWSAGDGIFKDCQYGGGFVVNIGGEGYYTTYLSNNYLYVNNTKGSIQSFDEPDMIVDDNIQSFISSIEGYHGRWNEERLAIIYKYKGKEAYIRMGE